jgi:hypothetical protein
MDFVTKLKGSGPSWWAGKGHRWSGGLIVVQVAVLLVLVLGAGLFLRTLHNLNSINLGFDRNNGAYASVRSAAAVRRSSWRRSRGLLGRIASSVTAAVALRAISNGGSVNLGFSINREDRACSPATSG